MKRLLLCITSLLVLSCHNLKYDQDLTRIENYIQEDPSSALDELSLLNGVEQFSSADKALFSLLFSMALDKNYIDISVDTLICPAVTYYTKTRDNYHAFLSYYYLGRVYENAGAYDDALSTYLLADNRIDMSVPKEYLTRLYFAKERIYFKQFALDRALSESKKAKETSKTIDNPLFYVRSCLDIANILQIQKSYALSVAELDSLSNWMISRNITIPPSYYRLLLSKAINFGNSPVDSIVSAYVLYCNACMENNTKLDTIILTDALIKMGDYSQAASLFQKVHLKPAALIIDSISYYSTAVNLYKGLRDFDKYVYYNQMTNELLDLMNMRIFNNDVRFIEERYNNQLAEIRAKRHKSVAIVILALLTMALIIAISVGRARKKTYMRDLKEAQGEYSFIRSAFNSEGSAAGIKALLGERLKALIPYFQGMPTRQLDRQMIRRIKTDNHEFLTNIGLLFAVSYPPFVSALASHGLNAEEIGLCSMYASGFISKELSGILDGGSIYQINCSIRTKLAGDIEGRTLPVWIREQFQGSNQ